MRSVSEETSGVVNAPRFISSLSGEGDRRTFRFGSSESLDRTLRAIPERTLDREAPHNLSPSGAQDRPAARPATRLRDVINTILRKEGPSIECAFGWIEPRKSTNPRKQSARSNARPFIRGIATIKGLTDW
jgi:hypothetical protein